ncbi:YitT family protein [bacterium]|nr:YitT family protein [bacterium]
MKKLTVSAMDYAGICGGLLLIALGLDLFLVPNKIAAGGISGVSVVLFHTMNLPVGASMLVMNIVLFIVGFIVIGKGFGLKTIISSALLSVFVDGLTYINPVRQLTDDLLIAVIFGDLLTGMGMAIVFNRNASTGGTDILARILGRYASINIGRALLIIDFAVAASAGVFLKSVEVGMYSLLAVIINCLSIDAFIDTFNISKKVLILSGKSEDIAKQAMADLNRGATFLPMEGAYTHTPMKMLMLVIRPRQTAQLREIVREIDPGAFMIVCNVNQVLGKGFRDIRDPAAEI